ncbi:MAG: DUF5655 domain-containing protein [Gemmatimonadetes bacterium]|nr:DUF5655 domain-containing protein [Gemmatimonadota bacterium]
MGFAAIEYGKGYTRVWARLSYFEPYNDCKDNRGWTILNADDTGTQELEREWMRADLLLAYARAALSKEEKIARIESDTERDAASSELRDLYDDLLTYIRSLGVQERENKHEVLFSRQGRFASIAFRPKLTQLGGRSAPNHVRVYLYIDASKLQKEINEGFIQKRKQKKEYVPRIRIYNRADLERAKPLLHRAYEEAKR